MTTTLTRGQTVITLPDDLLRTDAHGQTTADLNGVVVDAAGQVLSGRFVPGHNLVFATFEVTLEEWLPHVSTAAPTSAL